MKNNSQAILKIVIAGPTRVGKTVISNTLSEFSNVVPQDYHPTAGCRILECDKQFTEEQSKNIKYLKNNNISKIKIQLWDMSGDKKYEKCWPAIQQDMNGIILVIDSKNNKYDNILDEWVNNFCKGTFIENMTVFSYSRDEAVNFDAKQKICIYIFNLAHQFPNLPITEVTNDINSLIPSFTKYILGLISNMN